MKRNDKILIVILLLVAVSGFVAMIVLQRETGSQAVVTYHGNSNTDTDILAINLSDGSYDVIEPSLIYEATGNEDNSNISRCFIDEHIYCVQGELGVVVIEYINGKVRVIEETSPQNICQLQGETDSPAKPITCLPNYISITIKSEEDSLDFNS
ncbi:MAG: NusG domain II-containing protein [Candidatus Izemoplasmataceae bacterium]